MKKNIFRSRRFKHGTMATVMTAVMVAVVVLVNVIVGMLVERFPMEIDLTENRIFELSDQSVEYLKTVEEDIDITILATEKDFSGTNSYYNQANEVINRYTKYGKNISVEYVDIYSDPTVAQKYPKETLSYGQIVVSCGDRYQILTAQDLFNTQTSQTTGKTTIASSKAEQAMTSAIMFITDENPITVTVLNGFGSTGTTDLNNLTSLLNSNGYLINEINLMTEEIPEDTTVAILAAPTTDITEAEADKISAYLDNDGKMSKIMYYFADASQPELPVLESVLEEWGIVFEPGYLAETDMNNIYMSNNVMMQQYGENSTFTAPLDTSIPVLTINARPMKALWENDGNRYTDVLLSTYDTAVKVPADAGSDWDINSAEQSSYASVISAKRTSIGGSRTLQSYLIAFSSVGMTDSYFLNMSALNNSEFLVSTTNVLTSKKNGIQVVAKTLGTESLGISQQQAVNLGALFQYALPVAVLLIGTFVWIRRRNK